MLLVANEFLDALPVHQLVATERGWVERMVELAGTELVFALSERPSDLAGKLPPSERQRSARSPRSARRAAASPARSAGGSPQTAASRC